MTPADLFHCCGASPLTVGEQRFKPKSFDRVTCAFNQEISALHKQLDACRELHSQQNEDIILLQEEQKHIKIIKEHLECRILQNMSALSNSTGRGRARAKESPYTEAEISKAIQELNRVQDIMSTKLRERLQKAQQRCRYLEEQLEAKQKKLAAFAEDGAGEKGAGKCGAGPPPSLRSHPSISEDKRKAARSSYESSRQEQLEETWRQGLPFPQWDQQLVPPGWRCASGCHPGSWTASGPAA